MDEDRDGRVSEGDYNSSVAKEKLLLEAFGQCLPTPKVFMGDLTIGISKLPHAWE